jgi:hypothetical protein
MMRVVRLKNVCCFVNSVMIVLILSPGIDGGPLLVHFVVAIEVPLGFRDDSSNGTALSVDTSVGSVVGCCIVVVVTNWFEPFPVYCQCSGV